MAQSLHNGCAMAALNLKLMKESDRKRYRCYLIYQCESEEFLKKHHIQAILDKYAKFLPVPVQFGTKTEPVPDGEDEEGKPKYKSVEVDNIINDTSPIWTKAPAN